MHSEYKSLFVNEGLVTSKHINRKQTGGFCLYRSHSTLRKAQQCLHISITTELGPISLFNINAVLTTIQTCTLPFFL